MPTIRLATFNLKDFFLPRKEEETKVVEAKVANIAKAIVLAAADIVALQEVSEPSLVERVVQYVGALGYGVPLFGSQDRRGIRNAILSRLPVQWSQVHKATTLEF